jgi:hypothetical protein
MRLLALDAYINSGSDGRMPAAPGPQPQQPLFPAIDGGAAGDVQGRQADGSEPLQGQGSGIKEEAEAAAASKPAAAPVSRWTAIDEEEEKKEMPALPISKWLEQEQEAERARLAAAAAEAEADKIFSEAEESDGEPAQPRGDQPRSNYHFNGDVEAEPASTSDTLAAAAAAATPIAVDEKRRQRLREVSTASCHAPVINQLVLFTSKGTSAEFLCVQSTQTCARGTQQSVVASGHCCCTG